MRTNSQMIRVAFFIDGGFIDKVGRFYKFHHAQRARLAFDGLQAMTRRLVAEREKMDENLVQIVEAHYFRGRFPAAETEAAGKLKDQAQFDDVLIRTGIVQHYVPVKDGAYGPRETGVDVSLSLEAFDLAIHKGFDVFTLVAGDGDFVPLVRKLSSLGIRTMLLGWDVSYEYDRGAGKLTPQVTRTAQALIDVCSYPIMMHQVIDDRSRRDDPLVRGLFVPSGNGAEPRTS